MAYGAIVVGLGAHGSAAVAELARRGVRVLGIERFERGHEKGSSVGRSRIIRLSYFEHPDYVPLLRSAWQRWIELEDETGGAILFRTGGVYAGPPGCDVVSGALRSAREHGLEHEELDGVEMRRRFPWLRLREGDVGMFDAQAGYVVPERAIAAHLAVAERHGAALRFGDGVEEWHADGSGFTVRTRGGASERADRLVLTAGAWLPSLVPDLAPALSVERQPLFWFEPADPAPFRDIPVYIVNTADGDFYGFPYLADQGLKAARHGDGEPVDPDRLERSIRGGEDERVRRFVRAYLPGGDGELRGSAVCMYTRTPDGHFVVDRHPQWPGVVVASPCSGHGFKFASAMGRILADLAVEGRSALPIEFLRLDRPSMRTTPGVGRRGDATR